MSDKEKDLNQDDENLNQENQDSDDSFGLPELEYEPLADEDEESPEEEEVEQEEDIEDDDFEAEEVPDDEVTERPAYMEDNDSKAPLVIGLIVTVVIVLGALGYFMGWFDGLLGGEEPKQEVVEAQPEPEPEPVVTIS